MAMTSDYMGAGRSGTLGFGSTLALSIGFYGLLSFALMRSMRIDTYELGQTQIDFLAYWVGLLIAVVLGIRLFILGRLPFVALYLVLFLILYTTLVLILTVPGRSPIAFLLSRYGILMWFLLGIGAGGVFDVFQKARAFGKARLARTGFLAVSGAIGVMMTQFALQYLEFPFPTISYQSVANSASIFLIMTVGAMEALWGSRKPMLMTVAYLLIGTIIVAAIVRMQSASIAALWVGVMVVFFWGIFWNSRVFVKVLLVATLVAGAVYFAQTEAYEDISQNTRFAVFFGYGGSGASGFSSLTSRLGILSSFADQFAIAPLTGNFQAEILSGAGAGNYIHSLPLSFLTHTGVIGTLLAFAALALVLTKRLVYDPALDPAEGQFGRLMLVVLALGTISTFMSWSVFWFMMGVLCRSPKRLPGRT